MTEKEKNMAIYRALEDAAIEVWHTIEPNVPEGSYTAMQVHEYGMNGIRDSMELKEMDVEVDGFRCHFLNVDVFRVLHEFGKFAKVKPDEKHRFIKTEEKETELNALVRIEKEHKVLKAMVSYDERLPVISQLHLDAERGYLVASDGYMIGAMRIDMRMNIGEVKDACFNLPASFADVPGLLDLTKHTDRTYRYYSDKIDNSYREEDGCSYPRWYSIFPVLSEELNFRLRREEVKRLMRFLKAVTKLPSNMHKKNEHRVSFHADGYSDIVHVAYDNADTNTHTESTFLLEKARERPLAVCLCADRLLKLEKVWNGSLWFVHSMFAMVMDSDRQDSFLLLPMMPAEDDTRTYYNKPMSGVHFNVAWDKRYEIQAGSATSYELRAGSATSYELRATSEEKQNKSIQFMGYELEKLADGTYEVRGRKEKRVTEAIRQMAAYMMGKPEVQIKCQDYFNRKYGRGKEADKHYPLPEQELYDMLHGALLEQGIEVATVEQAEERKAKKQEPKPAPKGHLRIVDPETPPKPKQQEEEGAVKIERTTTMVGRQFYPLLLLTDGDTQVVVAGNSLYEAISDRRGDILDRYQELFDSTDAFIDDDLLTAGDLDETAICEAVSQFMDMVEQAS